MGNLLYYRRIYMDIQGLFNRKSSLNGGFSITMFDYRRVSHGHFRVCLPFRSTENFSGYWKPRPPNIPDHLMVKWALLKTSVQLSTNSPMNFQLTTQLLVGGWPPPLKNKKVSWDYYAQYMERHQIHVPNHQPDLGLSENKAPQWAPWLIIMVVLRWQFVRIKPPIFWHTRISCQVVCFHEL